MGSNNAQPSLIQRWHQTHAFSRDSLGHWPAILLLALAIGFASYFTGQLLVEHGSPLVRSGRKPAPVVVTPTALPVPTVVSPTDQERLQQLLIDFQAQQTTKFYVYVKDLKTGVSALLNADQSIPSGSIYKLFLANQVYRLVESGQLNLNSPVPGTGYTYIQCTQQMVQNSLNACGEAVRAHLGAASQTADLNAQGYIGTNLMLNEAAHTTANDVALLYQRLYDGGYFNSSHNEQFKSYLRNQMWRFRIPTGIPTEPLKIGRTKVLNKTGDVYGYANDAAIIQGENTDILLVILSGQWPKVFPDSSYAIRHLTGLIYNQLNHTNYPLPYTSL